METIFKIITNPIFTTGQVQPTPEPEVKKKRGRKKKEKIIINENTENTENTENREQYIQQENKKRINEYKFWTIIDNLAWRNTDEQIMITNQLVNKLKMELTGYNVADFIDIFNNKMNDINVAINYTGPDKKIIYAHIIALGSQFYNLVLSDTSLFYFISDAKIYQDFLAVINKL